MSAYWGSMFAYLSDVSPERFGESNGRIFQMCDLGIIIASFIAKILIDELLFELKNVFGFVAGLGLLFGILSIIILPETLLKGKRKQVSSIAGVVKLQPGSFLMDWLITILQEILIQVAVQVMAIALLEQTAVALYLMHGPHQDELLQPLVVSQMIYPGIISGWVML